MHVPVARPQAQGNVPAQVSKATKPVPTKNPAPEKPQPVKVSAQPRQSMPVQPPIMPPSHAQPPEQFSGEQQQGHDRDPWAMDWADDEWQVDQANEGDTIPFDKQAPELDQPSEQFGVQAQIPFETENQASNDPIGFDITSEDAQGDSWGFNNDAQDYGEPFLDPTQYDAELENLMGAVATNVQPSLNATTQYDERNYSQEGTTDDAGYLQGYGELPNQGMQEPDFLPDGAYETQSFLPEQNYDTQESYAGENFGQPDYAQGDYAQGEYAQGDYAQGDYAQNDYAQGEFAQGEYAQDEYAQGEYAQGDYAQNDYAQGEYAQGDYAQNDYAQGDYAQGEFAQGEYAQDEYAQGEYAQGDYAQNDYAQGDYAQGEYTQGVYAQDEYAQGEYAQGEYAQGYDGQNVYAEGQPAEYDYTSGEYAGEEYAQDPYVQGDYAQGEYHDENAAQFDSAPRGAEAEYMQQPGHDEGGFIPDMTYPNEQLQLDQYDAGMEPVSEIQPSSNEFEQEDVYATDAYAEPEQGPTGLSSQPSVPPVQPQSKMVPSGPAKPLSQPKPSQQPPVRAGRKTVPAPQARSQTSFPPTASAASSTGPAKVEVAAHRPLAPPPRAPASQSGTKVPQPQAPKARAPAAPQTQRKVPPRARSPVKPQTQLLSPPVVAERVQPPPALMEPLPASSMDDGDNWSWKEDSDPHATETVDDAWGWDGNDQDWQQPVKAKEEAYAPKTHVSPKRTRAKPAPSSSAGALGTKATVKPKSERALRVDPMQERLGKTVPVASFGIGGKLIVHLPQSKAEGDAYEYDTPRIMRQIHIRSLASYMGARPFSTLDMQKFPGPLMEASKSNHKAKKAAILKYLHEQIAESASGVGYLRRKSVLFSSDSHNAEQGHVEEWRRMEDKILLLKILALLVENDGQWNATGSMATTVCNLLTGRSEETELGAFTVPTYSRTSSQSAMKRPIRTYALRQGFLEELQPMLQQGDLQRAVDYAVEEKMWAHAMTISQQLDSSVRNRVIEEFMRYELEGTSADNMLHKDYTSIKVAYALYSSQSSEQITAMFRESATLSPEAQHAQWRHALATLIANHNVANGYETIVNAMGENLMANGLPEAAHACYLLSHQHRKWLGSGSSFLLLGTTSSTPVSALVNDMDALLMTEVLEFILCLSQPKGAEPFSGIPTLAPFKLMRAIVCDELGDTASAKKYCEALVQLSQTKGSAQILPPNLHLELHELLARLNGPHADGNHSWSKKLQRPTLDGVWGALEGRLTKFIAGEEMSSESQPPKSLGKGVGAFTHYSAITPEVASSDAPSGNEADFDNGHEEQGDFGDQYEKVLEQDEYVDYTGQNEIQDDQLPEDAQDLEPNTVNVFESSAPEEYSGGAYGEEQYAEGEYPGGEYAEGEYPEGNYTEGEYAEGQYAEGEYPEGEYAEGAYAEGQYAEGDYAEGNYAEGEFAEGEQAGGEYPEGHYAEGEYPEDQYAEGDYAEGEYPEGQYAEREYAEGEYSEGQYAEGEYPEGDYPEGEYPEGEYAEGEYPEGQYAEGEYPEGQYAEGEYPEGDYPEGQYAEGEYPEGQYAEGEYAEGEYPEGQYAEGEYPEGEYPEGEYAEGEYPDGQYAEGEYAEGEYAEGEYAEAVPPESKHKGANPNNVSDHGFNDEKHEQSTPADKPMKLAEQDPMDEATVNQPSESENAPQVDGEESVEQSDASKPPLFHTVDAEVEPEVGEDGLLSTMPVPTLGPVPVSPPKQETNDADDADDDLGLGNTGHKEPEKHTESKEEEKPAEKPAEKSTEKLAGNSWLGRLLGTRNNAQSQSDKEGKASKAHLGEETSFYYDKDLKRWINKKAGDDGKAAPAALPPPPKAAAKPATSSSEKQGPPASKEKEGDGAAKGNTAPSGKTGEAGYGDPPMRKPASSKASDRPPTGGASKKRPLKSRYIVVD
ncbi:hypothetical protein MEQU1_002121 [Malassezia equina]|uniref:Protein transport protein sec16 n=1 Tax=Malassezia equina TaxID=1381935 RepID=A0AAF0EIM8_9BASI|nr:hypothetical protein MEQU1_002121 [Malassezia equina]